MSLPNENDSRLLLQALVNNGTIAEGEVPQLIMNYKKNEALRRHPYTIRQLPNGRWTTYVKDESRKTKRRMITRVDREDLVVDLVSVYVENRKKGKCFDDLYREWHKKMLETNLDGGTLRRHEQYYKKFYVGQKWVKKPLKEVKTTDMEDWGNAIIAKYDLTNSAWMNLRGVANQAFRYARKHGYMKDNPLTDMDLTSRFMPANRHTPEEAVYNELEAEKLADECRQDFMKTGDIASLGALLVMQLCLRIGELLGLKWSDISADGEHITVERQ